MQSLKRAETGTKNHYFLAAGSGPADMELDYGEFEDAGGHSLEERIKEATRQLWVENSAPPWLLVYTDYQVFWGIAWPDRIELASSHRLEVEFLQELRLFGPRGEYYLWRNGDRFGWRLLVEGKTDIPGLPTTESEGYPAVIVNEPHIAEEWQALWCDHLENGPDTNPGWVRLKDGRGASFELPVIINNEANELPLRLLVRHYLDYHESGLCYYKDLRLVDLRDKKLQPLKLNLIKEQSRAGS